MHKDKKVVLFNFLNRTSFVDDDLAYLKDTFDIRTFYFGEGLKSTFGSILTRWIHQKLWFIKNIRNVDIIYGWFADYHMLIPVIFARIFKKPVVISMGGFDCFNLPEYKHGVFYSKWRGPIAKYILKRATMLLPVSGKLISSRNKYTLWPNEREFGLKTILPDLKTPILPMPTGYNPDEWPFYEGKRLRRICMVAYINSDRTFQIKGIDLLLEAAAKIPDIKVVIVGVTDEYAQHMKSRFDIPENVVLKSSIKRNELVKIYQQSSAYVQLSRIEGLPNVVCEAMLCGCTVVGSNVFGIPDIIGETGRIVENPNIDEIVDSILEVIDSEIISRQKARERIIRNYSADKRKKALTELFQQLANQ